uniref:Murine leukemia virus integrase C-terminal domain-containing protein n=1 Tax=Pygocentrus nattereri TaxID=42514 RepID=A0AAR2IQG0_PYGNA
MSCLRTSGKGPKEVQERLDEQKRDTIQPGDKVFVKVFRRKWYNERREGPFEVVRSTGTAVQVKGSPTWYHFSHCVKAPSDELPCLQSHDEGSRQSEGNAERCEEVEMHKDL